MTQNMLLALDRGEFGNKSWTNLLLHHFAEYYFKALRAYENQAPELPAVWHFAFESAKMQEISPIQKMLLGVNAHINFDLVLTLNDLLRDTWKTMPETGRLGYYQDYCHVNRIISQTIDAVQDQILEPAQPSMRIIDDLMGRTDEWLLSKLITHWRDKVWQHARLLLSADTPADANNIVQAVETRAIERARVLAGEGWPLKFGDIL